MVTLDQSQLRVIADPLMGLLHQLHKVVYITQLPPASNATPESISNGRARLVVERYKRTLFSPMSQRGVNLKTELKRLSEGVSIAIPIDFSVLAETAFGERSASPRSGSSPPKRVHSVEGGTRPGDVADNIWEQTSITYGQMRQLIEQVLHREGYYANNQDLTPIGDDAFA
jgi:NIMA (never in mitosis gene a)-related kinase 10